MKTNFLFPRHFRKIGWMIFVPAAILGIHFLFNDAESPFEIFDWNVFALVSDGFNKQVFFSMIENNVYDEILGLALLISLLFIAFSEEELEDEFIRQMRLDALVWATMVNAVLLFFCVVFIYDFPFMNVMIINMFSGLFLFVIRFNWSMIRSRNMLSYEK